MTSNLSPFTNGSPYVHERLMAFEAEQRERVHLRRAALGLTGSRRRSNRAMLARLLRAFADRIESSNSAQVQRECQPQAGR